MTGLHRSNTGFPPGRIQRWIRLIVLLFAACAARLDAAVFTVTLDRDTVQLGDTATLSLRFDGGEPSSRLELPEVPGLQYINANHPNISSFNINGKKTLEVSIVVKPTQIGFYTIPAITAKVGNESLTSQPLTIKAVRASVPEPGSEAEQKQLAFLRVKPPKKEVFLGEMFVLEMELLVKPGIRLTGADLPGVGQNPFQIDGCTIGKTVEGQHRQMMVGSTSFELVPLLIPVTAMKAGQLSLGPIDGAAVVELPSQRGGQRDFFDPFGMFNRGAQQRVTLSAPAQTLTVLPLPETGKPATFTGAVGAFQMAFSAGPTNLGVGDPVTLRVQIAGRGALDSVTLPEQPAWKEFKCYPPTAKTEPSGDLGIEGTKTFEQVVVPQNTEIKELPPFEFTYFDPEKRAYETLRQPATPLIVHPSGTTPGPALALGSKPAETPAAQDIVHIKPRLGAVTADATPWVRRPWFLALQCLPMLALAGAATWRRRSDALANNPRLRRRRQVEQVVRDGLAHLRTAAAGRQSDEFFATTFRLLQEQIGERLDLPASAITEAVVDDKLRGGGLPAPAAEALHELFQHCNQARYAPMQSAELLEAVIPKVESTLQALQEVKA
jgi:hypothetical protein